MQGKTYTLFILLLWSTMSVGQIIDSLPWFRVEWQLPAEDLVNAPFVDTRGTRSGDFNGDGFNDYAGFRNTPEGPAFIVVDGSPGDSKTLLAIVRDFDGRPITDYRYMEIGDIVGEVNDPDGGDDIVFASREEPFETRVVLRDSSLWPKIENFSLQAIENVDGDPQAELIGIATNWNDTCFKCVVVLGEGLTLASPEPPGFSSPEETSNLNLMVERVIDDRRWPAFDRGYLQPGFQDLDRDEIPDITLQTTTDGKTEISIYSGAGQELLINFSPDDLVQFNDTPPLFRAFFLDMSGDSPGPPFKDVLILGLYRDSLPFFQDDLSTADEIFLYDSEGQQLYDPRDLSPQLANARFSAAYDLDRDGATELILQVPGTRKLAIIGDGAAPGIVSGDPRSSGSRAAEEYSLSLKFESEKGFRTVFRRGALFNGDNLDLNGDGLPEFLVTRLATGDTTALGLAAFEKPGADPLFAFTFPEEQATDLRGRFHGAADANADGEKELVLGNGSIVLLDGSVVQPLPGFEIRGFLDVDGDGHEDLIGYDTENEVMQVWGFDQATSTQERLRRVSALQLSPNPAGERVQLTYELLQSGRVWIQLFNAQGGRVQSWINELQSAGTYQHELALSPSLPAGIFYVVLSGNGWSSSKKLVVAP